MATAPQIPDTRYAGPPFDRAKVHDAMRVGVVTCRPQTPLADVARMMIGYRMHSVVVDDPGSGPHPWGIVSALDVARAAGSGMDQITAGEMAETNLVTIATDETLQRAAQLMTENEVSHLIAVDPDSGRPAGVISALGLAAVAARGGTEPGSAA